jgi:hypothetical protein
MSNKIWERWESCIECYFKNCLLFLDLSEVKKALEAELRKCNSSCKDSLENYVANMSTNADFQQVSQPNCEKL